MTEQAWFSDDPLASAAGRFGRQSFLERLESTVRDAASGPSSTVFGLVGPWGSGKTSMLRWLEDTLTVSDEDRWKFVTFEPWAFQDVESLQRGFFEELATAFSRSGATAKVRKRLAGVAESIAPITSLGSLVGIDPSDAVQGAAKLLNGDQSLSARRRKLEKELAAAKTPVLVTIDDLDRLNADELLLTLKLVRLVGRLPYVHYLLSFDEETVLDVLTRTSLVGEGAVHRARDYLEKVVQVRLDVPVLRQEDTTELVNDGLNILAQQGVLELTDDQAARFSSTYFSHVAPAMTTPRTIRRCFAQVRLLSPQLQGEVDPVDFLLLTWLRTTHPRVHAGLQAHRDEIVDNYGALRFNLHNDSQIAASSRRWHDLLNGDSQDPQESEHIAGVVTALFPRFASIWQSKKYSGSGRVDPFRIANDEYFDRFFLLGIPPNDLPDATIRTALDGLRRGQANTELLQQIVDAARQNARRIVSKISTDLDTSRRTTPDVFQWLGRLDLALPETNDLLSPERQLVDLVAILLRRLSEEELIPALEGIARSGASELLLTAVRRAQSDVLGPDGEGSLLLDGKAQRVVSDHLAATLVPPDINGSNDRMPRHLSRLLGSWLHFDSEAVRSWLDQQSPVIQPLERAMLFAQTGWIVGPPDPPVHLSGIDLEAVGRVADLDAIRVTYSAEIASARRPDDFNHWPDTTDNWRELVLHALQQSAPAAEQAETRGQ